MRFSEQTLFGAFKVCCLVILFAIVINTTKVQANTGQNDFPEFPIIRNNVDFWEKIYSTYSLNTAVVHDQNDLTKIYEVVTLVDKDLPEARRINNSHLETIKEKYSQILLRLSAGQPPETRDEKRVANMFQGPSAHKAMRFAAENIRAQNGQKERFLEGTVRSARYLNRIRQIFHEYGLPADLAYLPHVESSFNYQAYSKCGAAGIWQFTRSTGKQYMRIDRHVDERRDPLISTRAAAKLLKKNYEALGSWPLALTAYNYGTAGMVRAVESHGSYENIFRNYEEGYFKFASRNFYSEFLAARKLAKEMAGNHVQRPGASAIQRSSSPIGSTDGDTATRNLKAVPTTKNTTVSVSNSAANGRKNLGAEPHFRLYTVKNGDTATSIAASANISVQKLCQENNLKAKAILRAGQGLRIPAQASSYQEKENLQSTSARKKRSAAATHRKNLLYDFSGNTPALPPALLHGNPKDSICWRMT
jgi:membrane-bound lytic murein transglycosylase D